MTKWAPWVLDVGKKGFNVGTNLRNGHQIWRPRYPNFKIMNDSFKAIAATGTDHTRLELKNIQTKFKSSLIFGGPNKCGNIGASNDSVGKKKRKNLKGAGGDTLVNSCLGSLKKIVPFLCI